MWIAQKLPTSRDIELPARGLIYSHQHLVWMDIVIEFIKYPTWIGLLESTQILAESDSL